MQIKWYQQSMDDIWWILNTFNAWLDAHFTHLFLNTQRFFQSLFFTDYSQAFILDFLNWFIESNIIWKEGAKIKPIKPQSDSRLTSCRLSWTAHPSLTSVVTVILTDCKLSISFTTHTDITQWIFQGVTIYESKNHPRSFSMFNHFKEKLIWPRLFCLLM